MRSDTWKFVVLFLGAVAARLVFHALTGFTADDAFITFRYADNIAHGLGFVYNAGEHVLGTSTPLFTFVLATVSAIGIQPQHTALFISLVASGVTAVVLYRYAQAWRFGDFAWFPAVAFVLWPRSVPSESCGMETALFTAFTVSALYFRQRRESYWALACATLATATRIEGLILLAILIVAEAVRKPGQLLSLLMIPCTILVPWIAFSWTYFGSPIPHSISAKLALYSHLADQTVWSQLSQVLGLHHPLSIPLWVAAGTGLSLIWRTRRDGLVEGIWLAGMILFFGLSKTRVFFWYLAPMAPVYLLLASTGLAIVAERYFRGLTQSRWFVPTMLCLAGAVLIASWRTPVKEYSRFQQVLDECHASIGLYLRAHTNETDLIAAEDIGYMGYLSNRRILDRDGLVSPEAVPYNRSGKYFEMIHDYRPDWVVASPVPFGSFLTDSAIFAEYDLKKRFTSGEADYWVLKRK